MKRNVPDGTISFYDFAYRQLAEAGNAFARELLCAEVISRGTRRPERRWDLRRLSVLFHEDVWLFCSVGCPFFRKESRFLQIL